MDIKLNSNPHIYRVQAIYIYTMKRKDFLKFSTASAFTAALGLADVKASEMLKNNSFGESALLCTTCGTKFKLSFNYSENCPVCSNDRQYLPIKGQSWTKPEDLSANFSNVFKKIDEHLYETRTVPKFAIGQRAFLILTPQGNILWDCISLLNDSTIAFIQSLGGLKAIAISHPHYYSSMNEWASAFNCPIYIHAQDQEFVFNASDKIIYWSGKSIGLLNDIQMMNIGGHFPGSSILHVPFLSDKGTVFCGDTFYISPNKKHISVMYSYPNFIPVKVSEIQRINGIMANVQFDSLIGAFDNQNINSNAKDLLHTSFGKYQ